MLRHFYQRTRTCLAALAVTGAMAFQGSGCDLGRELATLLDESTGDATYWEGYGSGHVGSETGGTVDPLGIDVDLPYFEEGDYFEVPAGLF